MTKLTPAEIARTIEVQRPFDMEAAVNVPMIQDGRYPSEEISVAPASDPVLAMIERAAMAGNIDAMERLLAMRDRLDAERRQKAWAADKAAAQAEIDPVANNGKNDQTRSTFAKLDAISRAINPIITRHGFAMTFYPAKSDREGYERVICEMEHREGERRTYDAEVPSDGAGMKGNSNKTPTHAFGSTMSYGRRYLMLMLWNVATGDDDDGQKAGKPASADPLMTADDYRALKARIDAQGDAAEKVEAFILRNFGVETLADLTKTQMGDALVMIAKREAKQQGAA